MTEHHRKVATFNSPLEAGVRSLALLASAYPASFDLQRLLQFDYLLVHSGDAGGPDSLHPPLPLRSGELLVRRALIEKGLLLMNSRGLLHKIPRPNGFDYIADDSAGPFMDALNSSYMKKLKDRAQWVTEHFGEATLEELSNFMRKFFADKWTSEFQPHEHSRGAKP